MKNRVVIFGGTGFLGLELFRQLKALNYQVLLLGRNQSIIPDGNFGFFDFTKTETYPKLLKSDIIVNCLGQVSTPIIWCALSNTQFECWLSKSVSDVGCKMIKISSLAVLGSCKFANEETLPSPETVYGAFRLASEEISRFYNKHCIVIRLSNLYSVDVPKGVFAYLRNSALKKEDVSFNHDGSMVRYFLHVEDAATDICAIIKLALEDSKVLPGVIHISGNEQLTMLELYSLFQTEMDNPIPKLSLTKGSKNIPDQITSHKSLFLEFSLEPRHNIVGTIKALSFPNE